MVGNLKGRVLLTVKTDSAFYLPAVVRLNATFNQNLMKHDLTAAEQHFEIITENIDSPKLQHVWPASPAQPEITWWRGGGGGGGGRQTDRQTETDRDRDRQRGGGGGNVG